MFVRNNQNVRRRDRMNISECCHLVIPINDGGFDFIPDDFAEDTLGQGIGPSFAAQTML